MTALPVAYAGNPRTREGVMVLIGSEGIQGHGSAQEVSR